MSVNTDLFVKEMTKMWSTPIDQGGFGFGTNPALLEAWKIMCDTFNRHMNGDVSNQWSVLPLPTGTGKTQGLSLYCALLAQDMKEHKGVLIITRFTDQADELRDRINELSSSLGFGRTAECVHSKMEEGKKLRAYEIKAAPVLIITHSQYSRIMEASLDDTPNDGGKSQFMYWGDNDASRRLTVIDESLDVIEDTQVHLDEISSLLGFIPDDSKKIIGNELLYLFQFHLALKQLKEEKDLNEEDRVRAEKFIPSEYWEKTIIVTEEPDFSKVKEVLRKVAFDQIAAGKSSKELRNEMYGKQTGTIDSMLEVTQGWSWYAKKGNNHYLSAPYVALPTNLQDAVVLDATAEYHHIYKMLKGFVNVIPIPKGARSYANVRLYIVPSSKQGKSFLENQPKSHFDKVVDEFIGTIGTGKKTLFCVHKANIGHFKDRDDLTDSFADIDVANWGNIDGKNDWKHMDSMVIHGLPYLDNIHPNNVLIAIKDWYNKATGSNDPIGVFTSDMQDKSDYTFGHIVTSLVQAINRVHCRTVIDADGNCPPTDVLLYLAKKPSKVKLIEAIRNLMPNIQIIELARSRFDGDDEEYNASQTAFVSLLKGLPVGSYPADDLIDKLGISKRTMERLITEYKITDSQLAKDCLEMNVGYESKKGPNGGKWFIKSVKAETTHT